MFARTPALRRYNWRVVWLSLAYAAFLISAVYGFKHQLVPERLKYVVAVLPALPIVGIFVAIGRYLVEEQDEYVRMLMVARHCGQAPSCLLWRLCGGFSKPSIWSAMSTAIGRPSPGFSA